MAKVSDLCRLDYTISYPIHELGEPMKALVLAGGKGTRLRPLTHTIAKQLIPVANRPVIHYVMDHLSASGIQEIGVIVSPETGDQIREALGSNTWKLDFTFIPQEEPLGLAHTTLLARDFLGDEPFVMYLGDNLIRDGLGDVIDLFNKSEADAALLLKEVTDPSQFGVAVLDNDGPIQRLVEKPSEQISNMALVGVYCFSPAIHEAVSNIQPSARGELEITDAIQYLLETKNKVVGQRIDGWWLDCGKKDDLLEANLVVLDDWHQTDIRGDVDEASRITGRVAIGEGAIVRKSELRGPVVVGSGTVVEDSFIGPYSSVGRDCHISSSSLANSVILNSVKIIGVTRLEDSVIGQNATIKSDTDSNRATRLAVGDDAEVEI